MADTERRIDEEKRNLAASKQTVEHESQRIVQGTHERRGDHERERSGQRQGAGAPQKPVGGFIN